MSQAATHIWEKANQTYLMARLSEVRLILENFFARPEEPKVKNETSLPLPFSELSPGVQSSSALESLAAMFGLSSFERKILLMCAGIELDSRFRNLLAASDNQRYSLPTFSLALAAFEDAHWSALSPERPLRYWRLVDVMAGDTFTTIPLRIDERILHYLTGIACIDERLRSLTKPLPVTGALSRSQRALAEQVAKSWIPSDRSAWPVVQLCGSHRDNKRAIAAAACAMLGLNLRFMPAPDVTRVSTDLDLFARLWEREAALAPSALLLECEALESSDAPGGATVQWLVETLRCPLLVSARERRALVEHPQLSFDVPKLPGADQIEIWREALGPSASLLNGTLERLVSHFSLSGSDIRSAADLALEKGEFRPNAAAARAGSSPDSPVADAGAEITTELKIYADDLASRLWDACRAYARPCLEGLAQRIEPAATWDDLVLPERQKQLLREITVHVRQRSKVYERWGFALKGARGLGITGLFAGPSGTGKTMASEILANELKLDLYRIDLSQVVSKYIGETEKNLRRVFDAAENGAAILLFDEADALFGKRSEVKDSHDRYANVEVSYLLQRMEAYRGLAILTTNRREALDAAFLRRIRFVVEFPFPDAAQRADIWRRVFPLQTPTADLRIDHLARLNAAGGHIRNIALAAAFLAADAGEPVRMLHLLRAARSEFAKLERPLTDSDFTGWV